jgi:hypothetical protein
MHRTVRSYVRGCGIISDVRGGRAIRWVAVWAAGAAVAVLVAWLGVRAVLRTTTGPLVPVVDPSPASVAAGSGPGSAGPAPARTLSPGGPSASVPSAGAPASRPPKTSPAPTRAARSSGEHTYGPTGGRVVLRITSTRCFLVSEKPDGGYTSQNWSSMGWLRVDFDRNGNEASSLICDWYQQAPAVTIGS